MSRMHHATGRRLGIWGWAMAMTAITLAGAGCAGRTSILPNPDSELRKTSTEFAADAASRKYPTDAPRGGDAKGARVDYVLRKVDVENLSDTAWTNVEVWVDSSYVVSISKIDPKKTYPLPFQAIYDGKGHYYTTVSDDNKKRFIQKVEVVLDGKVYTLPFKLAD